MYVCPLLRICVLSRNERPGPYLNNIISAPSFFFLRCYTNVTFHPSAVTSLSAVD